MYTAPTSQPVRVVIVGAGVAGLEAALALRSVAGDRVKITMLDPESEFVYRPMAVREPFACAAAKRYPLAGLASDIGVELRPERFSWLDSDAREVHTAGGTSIGYDDVLLALGARPQTAFRHALTLDYRTLDEQLHGVILDVEGGYLSSLAFVIPAGATWMLPAYELALMSADRAYGMGVSLSVTVVTGEDRPLSVFGAAASKAVAAMLRRAGIELISGASCQVPSQGRVSILSSDRELRVDRVIAMPELFGPQLRGVPADGPGGFVKVDPCCRVRGLDRVFAAGDMIDFPVKHGGLAAQQADVAATAIAALAGAPVTPRPLRALIEGVLLGGEEPLHMLTQFAGALGGSSHAESTSPWDRQHKIFARYLTPYLDRHDARCALPAQPE